MARLFNRGMFSEEEMGSKLSMTNWNNFFTELSAPFKLRRITVALSAAVGSSSVAFFSRVALMNLCPEITRSVNMVIKKREVIKKTDLSASFCFGKKRITEENNERVPEAAKFSSNFVLTNERDEEGEEERRGLTNCVIDVINQAQMLKAVPKKGGKLK